MRASSQGCLYIWQGAIDSFVGYLLIETGDGDMAVENVALLGRRGHLRRIKEKVLRIALPGCESGGPRFFMV